MGTEGQREARNVGIVPFPNVARRFRAKMNSSGNEILLDTVLNNMSQGVLMFDAKTQVVFCNQRYVEMYRLPNEVARPGCTLRDLLNHRMEARTFSGDTDEYIASLLSRVAEGQTFYDIVKLTDGRAFSIVNKPMQGGGWLATHEDITER
jgi:PAS domain-containing protein